MQPQPHDRQPERPEQHNSLPRLPLIFFIIVILCIALGVTIWIYLSPEAVIPYALITGFGVILSLFQFNPFSAHKPNTPTESTIRLEFPHAPAAPFPLPSFEKTAETSASVSDEKFSPQLIEQPEADQAKVRDLSHSIWNVPYPRNPFFTGREDILRQLHDLLRSNTAVAMTQPHAISGLGGIGKTQIASEYAYRYSNEYQVVLWVNCSFREELVAGFVSIAGILNLPEQNIQNLPEKNIQNPSVAINAVKRWLETHTGWLLILDNADDLAMVHDFLSLGNKGHILLTTRSQTMGGLAHKIEIEKMGLEDGMLFLLRRAAMIVPGATINDVSEIDQTQALEIVKALDGLPLALDQAGAFIEETKCGLSSYLMLYRVHRTKLLNRRGGLMPEHPEPVATTWSLSFENVERATPASVEILRLCSCLAPDAIPEEICTKGTSYPGTVLHLASDLSELNAAIAELLKYSLIQRDPSTHILTIHRLVQAVIKDEMDKDTQHLWAEYTVKAMDHTFPEVEFKAWPDCQRLLPHTQICKVLIEEWSLDFPESARLLYRAGHYLLERLQYLEAEPFVQQALTIREKVLGPEHLDTATSLNDLGWLYQCQGKYEQAETPVRRALAIREKVLGSEHLDTASSLNELAWLYERQGKYDPAEPRAQQVLAIREKVLGVDHPDTATSLNDLGWLYQCQGKYEQAEPLVLHALAIREKSLGSENLNTATSLNNLAMFNTVSGTG